MVSRPFVATPRQGPPLGRHEYTIVRPINLIQSNLKPQTFKSSKKLKDMDIVSNLFKIYVINCSENVT